MYVDKIIDIKDLPTECIHDCSHQGACDEDVEHWQRKLNFTVNRANAINYLAATGAWDREELTKDDDDAIARRVLWLVCCDFNEENANTRPDNGCGT